MKPILMTLAAAMLLAACGHTNNLAKYDLKDGTVLFRASARGNAASSHVVIESPTKDAAGEVAAFVGSLIVGSQGRDRLERAVNGDSIALGVARGMEQATVDYLKLRPVSSIAENPTFIVETELTDYALVSTTLGMCVRVTGRSRMIDRASGGLVWENSETHTVPLTETYLAVAAPRVARSGVSIFNAFSLLALDDEELLRVINAGAAEAGREIGEELREDIADMNDR
jgi:hypothetical protein